MKSNLPALSRGLVTERRQQVLPATADDADYVYEAFARALSPYYGGDHFAHAQRVINTHLAGRDERGLLSTRQVLLILWDGTDRRGVLNLVFKRQGTCKISPLILYPDTESGRGLGAILLEVAAEHARTAGLHQLYCTVAENNREALAFFEQSGFAVCGRAVEQYKHGETELMLRRPITGEPEPSGQQSVISVTEVRTEAEWREVRRLLLPRVTRLVDGAGSAWLESLRRGAESEPAGVSADERHTWVYCARDRSGQSRAAAIVSSKKGDSLKVMPIVAADAEAFLAMVLDLPSLLAGKGRKAYIHHVPTADEVGALQDSGWQLEAQLPHAYRRNVVTQQWGWPLDSSARVKNLRIQQRYLSMIASGQKTLEIRVGYDHVKRIAPGERLRLVAGRNALTCHVAAVRSYADFATMLHNEDVNRALPGLPPDEALRQLQQIYPPEKERLGVIVIELVAPASQLTSDS